jgi:hypothetical protein
MVNGQSQELMVLLKVFVVTVAPWLSASKTSAELELELELEFWIWIVS